MNRMNVNFFICEKSLFFFHFVLFGGSVLFGERAMAAVGSIGEPSRQAVGGAWGLAGPSLSRLFCVSHAFSFKIGILHVEPAREDSEISISAKNTLNIKTQRAKQNLENYIYIY